MTTRWFRICLLTIFTLVSVISPIAPPITRFNVLSIFPCHAVLVSPHLWETMSCSLNLEKNTETDSVLIVLGVKINQRSACIVHKGRLVETQKVPTERYKLSIQVLSKATHSNLWAHPFTLIHSPFFTQLLYLELNPEVPFSTRGLFPDGPRGQRTPAL